MPILPGSDFGKAPEANPQLAMPTMGPLNQEPMLSMRRVVQLDSGPRIAGQLATDLGLRNRPPVGPAEYAEGNIKKSTQLSGPAGYNQRNIPLPESPDDMSQAEYMLSMTDETPKARQMLRNMTMVPKQNFLRTPSFSDNYPYQSSNTVNNLLALARARKKG